jgi:hypothetical protein
LAVTSATIFLVPNSACRRDDLVVQRLVGDEVRGHLDVRVRLLEACGHRADVLLAVAGLLHEQRPDAALAGPLAALGGGAPETAGGEQRAETGDAPRGQEPAAGEARLGDPGSDDLSVPHVALRLLGSLLYKPGI